MATKSVAKRQSESKPTVDINSLMVTFHHGGKVWTTTATKLGYALVEVGGPTSQKAHDRMRALLTRVCEQAFAEGGPDGYAAMFGEPSVPPLPVAGLTFQRQWGDTRGPAIPGVTVTRLLALAEHMEGGPSSVTSGDEALMLLKGVADVLETATGAERELSDDAAWALRWVLHFCWALLQATVSFTERVDSYVVTTATAEGK